MTNHSIVQVITDDEIIYLIINAHISSILKLIRKVGVCIFNSYKNYSQKVRWGYVHIRDFNHK